MAPSGLHQILLDLEMVDDEFLALGGVLAHEEREQFVAAVQVGERHGIKADAGTDEILELLGRDFAQSLEARDLGGSPEPGHRRLLLPVRIAVGGLLLVAHAEQRRLENEQVAARNEVRKILQEERN